MYTDIWLQGWADALGGCESLAAPALLRVEANISSLQSHGKINILRAFRRAQLKFKLNIRTQTMEDCGDFEGGVVVGARWLL